MVALPFHGVPGSRRAAPGAHRGPRLSCPQPRSCLATPRCRLELRPAIQDRRPWPAGCRIPPDIPTHRGPPRAPLGFCHALPPGGLPAASRGSHVERCEKEANRSAERSDKLQAPTLYSDECSKMLGFFPLSVKLKGIIL
jgi:hypothetical protein